MDSPGPSSREPGTACTRGRPLSAAARREGGWRRAGWLLGLLPGLAASFACHAPVRSPGAGPPEDAHRSGLAFDDELEPDDAHDAVDEDGAADAGRPRDPERHAGTWLQGAPGDAWGLRMRFPVAVGWTDFDLDRVPGLDELTTVSVVPVLEVPWALDARWTLTPYVGLGAAYQNGDQLLVDGERGLGLARVGARLHRWQAFAERYTWIVQLEARYDSVLSSRNGLLGDWGSVDAGVELRAVLGDLGPAPRLQPGVFVQGVHYWQEVELELEGVSPAFVDDQVEFGVSLGTHRPVRVLGFALPRVRLGYLVGSELRGFRLSFGGL